MKYNFEKLKVREDEIIPDKNTRHADELCEYAEILLAIANSLKKYRMDNNLTQVELADILDMNQVMVSKLERGDYNPTFKLLHKISYKLTGSNILFMNVLGDIEMNIDSMSCNKKKKTTNTSKVTSSKTYKKKLQKV